MSDAATVRTLASKRLPTLCRCCMPIYLSMLFPDAGLILREDSPIRRSFSRRPIPKRTAFLISSNVRRPLPFLPEKVPVLLLHVPFPEAVSRMEGVEGQNGHDYHRALEADEQMLVPDQGARPALAQLGDPVDGSDEDAERRQCQRDEEDAELGAASQGRVLRVQGGVAQGPHPPQRLDHKVQTQYLEHEQRRNLERQSRYHDVIARVGALVLVAGYGCHATADGLEEEGDDVAWDEDAWVRERLDVRVLGAEGDDDAGKCEVDARCEESGRDCQADDLHEETVL